jgi:hypothetical protein
VSKLAASTLEVDRAHGQLFGAALSAAQGDRERCIDEVKQAIAPYEKFDFVALAECSRIRLCEYLGDEQKLDEVTARLASLGVADPLAYSRCHVPLFARS